MKTLESPLEAPLNPIQYIKDEDFLYRYANNAFFESTSWDLKITFGQTETQISPNSVIQHTAITVPWPYAKVLVYFLQVQIAAKEAEDGRIVVPKGILRPPPNELPKEAEGKLKHPQEGIEAIKRTWAAFVAANPELQG
jgi:hypothetical protein